MYHERDIAIVTQDDSRVEDIPYPWNIEDVLDRLDQLEHERLEAVYAVNGYGLVAQSKAA